MLKKILLGTSLIVGLAATSAFAAAPTPSTSTSSTTTTSVSSTLPNPITNVKATVSISSPQDLLKLTWVYVNGAYGYNVYIDGVKQPGNPLKDPNVSVVDDGVSYYQQWSGYIAKGVHTVGVTVVYPDGSETVPYNIQVNAQ